MDGGGVVSVIIAGPLLGLFKKTGAAIIIVLLAIVFIMLISNVTIVDVARAVSDPMKGVAGAVRDVREDSIRRSEERRQAREKVVPNDDVPEEVAKESQAKFNVDIPIPMSKKKKADKTVQVDAAEDIPELPQHPVVSLKPEPVKPAVKEEKPAEPVKAVVPEKPVEMAVPKTPAEAPEKPAEVSVEKPAAAVPEKPAEIVPEEPEKADDSLVELIRKATEAKQKAKEEAAARAAVPAEPVKPKTVDIKTTHTAIKPNDEEYELPPQPTAADIAKEISENENSAPDIMKYAFPPIDLLKPSDNSSNAEDAEAEMRNNAETLVNTLQSFGVQTRIVDIHRGPTVTRYELQPSAGVKISKITGLSDDIALNLAAAGVRIEAPIPGKAAVGVEVPNRVKDVVSIREMIESDEFKSAKSKLAFVVGRDIEGNVIVGDIAKMPHVIIAGTTGSGKSVCTNSIIMSILYNASPDEVRLVLIDPKMVEFKIYDGIPHLLIPVVTDPRKAAGALSWAVQEMLKRYKLFADSNVRDLKGYNELAAETEGMSPLPQIVIAIDELADLMMAASNEVEDAICRLAQMARAAGMHLIIATQRPTVDVITGLIKANIPSRIALTVSSQVDSRTIIDTAGAEKLLGYGDMLYYPSGIPKPIRIQGCFCSSKEVEAVVAFIKSGGTADYSDEILREIEKNVPVPKGEKGASDSGSASGDMFEDDMVEKAIEVVIEAGQASTSSLQRRLKLGYARAARIIDQLEELGVVGPFEGAKPRAVLMTREMWLQRKLAMEGGGNEPSAEEVVTVNESDT
ncbi:MAG: DNA translocase FtsK [Oscillospiraceae bacterium]|nr:DNA translocase FtsK [Oscillospiraceae bacterium]